jgi:predicted SAM-dependent methyltransferase
MSKTLLPLCKKVTAGLGFPPDFGRLAKFEFQIFWVRWRGRLSPGQIRALRRLRKGKDWRIHFGCGDKPAEGWINVDGVPNPRAELFLDLRRPLPLATGSADCIFSEHVIEHLRDEEADRFFRECHRILKPGGAIRLVTPDLEKFARAYLADDRDFFLRASPEAPEAVNALNLLFRRSGHHNYIFDYGELERFLRRAGFPDVRRSSFGHSARPGMNLDCSDDQRRAESLYVEAFK